MSHTAQDASAGSAAADLREPVADQVGDPSDRRFDGHWRDCDRRLVRVPVVKGDAVQDLMEVPPSPCGLIHSEDSVCCDSEHGDQQGLIYESIRQPLREGCGTFS